MNLHKMLPMLGKTLNLLCIQFGMIDPQIQINIDDK